MWSPHLDLKRISRTLWFAFHLAAKTRSKKWILPLASSLKSSAAHNAPNSLLIACERLVPPVNNVDKFPLFGWLPATIYVSLDT